MTYYTCSKPLAASTIFVEEMYAGATFLALSRRSTRIHDADWRQSRYKEKGALAQDIKEGKAHIYDVF